MTKSFDIDIKAIRSLAAILEETHLSEIEYEIGDQRVKVKKQLQPAASSFTVAQPSLSVGAPSSVAPAIDNTPLDKHPGALKSPMVGTLYRASQPGSPSFVEEGSTVSAGSTVCIIEAMKVMNTVKAHKSGVVKKIMVKDASPVEFDEILMIIE